MNTPDSIVKLIQEADTTAEPAPCNVQVDVDRIYRRARQQHWTRQAMASAAAVMIVLGVVIGYRFSSKPAQQACPPLPTPSLAELEAQADRLMVQMDFLMAMDNEVQANLKHTQTIAALEAQLRSIEDPMDQVRANLDQVAQAMVASAELFEDTPGLRPEAVQAYKAVVDLVPDHTWAQVAQNRLSKLTY